MWDLYGAIVTTLSSVFKALIGTPSPASGDTTTVMGYAKLIEDQIGPDSPSSGARTSVMSFLKLIENLIVPVAVSNNVIGFAATTATSLTTAHSFTGAGVLKSLSNSAVTTSNLGAISYGYIKLTVDGTVLYDGNVTRLLSSQTSGTAQTAYAALVENPIRFSTSLLIEHKSATNVDVSTRWHYTT